MLKKSEIIILFFFCTYHFAGVADAKTKLRTKLNFPEENKCPKIVLLLYEHHSRAKGKWSDPFINFERQINQTLNLIKSILITKESNDCVLVILVANKKNNFEKIKTEIYSWATLYTNNLHLEYVPLKYPKSRKWMRNIYRPGSTFGILLPDILPYDSVIYMDTDLLFLRNVRDLWSEMNKFTSTALASALIRLMPIWMIEIPVIHNTGLGAGVMHMNLTRMRERKWTQNMVTMGVPYLLNIKFGFEDFLNIYIHKFPEEVHLLSCDWNYWFDRCKVPCDDEDEGIKGGISIIHGNHLTFTDMEREPLFRAVYEAFDNTNLTTTLDLADLVHQIKAGMDLQRKIYPMTPCAKSTEFDELVLKRLRQKL